MERSPSDSYSLTLRVKLSTRAGTLGEVATAIGKAGGDIGAIDIVSVARNYIIRDITVNTVSSEHEEKIVNAVKDIDGIEVIQVSDRTFLMHIGGKIEVVSKMPLKTRADLSMAYTPGVARVCEAIHADPEKAFNLTIKKNTVAVITDGTAVLGLGDIGPAAAMPVMEGKAMLFKEFGGVNAFPICPRSWLVATSSEGVQMKKIIREMLNTTLIVFRHPFGRLGIERISLVLTSAF